MPSDSHQGTLAQWIPQNVYHCRVIVPIGSLAFLSTVWVEIFLNLAFLAVSRDTIVWLGLVSGMQLSKSLSEGASIGPSHSGISGVGLPWLFLLTSVSRVQAWPGAPKAGKEAADCCDCASIGSWYKDASEGGYSMVWRWLNQLIPSVELSAAIGPSEQFDI